MEVLDPVSTRRQMTQERAIGDGILGCERGQRSCERRGVIGDVVALAIAVTHLV